MRLISEEKQWEAKDEPTTSQRRADTRRATLNLKGRSLALRVYANWVSAAQRRRRFCRL